MIRQQLGSNTDIFTSPAFWLVWVLAIFAGALFALAVRWARKHKLLYQRLPAVVTAGVAMTGIFYGLVEGFDKTLTLCALFIATGLAQYVEHITAVKAARVEQARKEARRDPQEEVA